MITEAWRSVDLLSIEHSPLYFQEDSRTSTSFSVFASGTYIKLTGVLIGVSFIQIAQTVRELLMCFDPPTQRGQTIAWFLVLLILFCSLPGILRQPHHLARERETFGLSVHVRLTVPELASLGKKKKEERKLRFFQNLFSWLL